MPIIIEPEEDTEVTIPSSYVGDVPPNDGLKCIACAADGVFTPLVRTHARGAPPRYCDDHKKNKGSSEVRSGRATNTDKLVEGIKTLYMQVGMVISFVAVDDGTIIAANAETLGESWRSLIERDPKVRKMWEKMLIGSGWSGVIVAHAMVAYPIMSNHGLIPKGKTNLKSVS